jgi:hypothetical protein
MDNTLETLCPTVGGACTCNSPCGECELTVEGCMHPDEIEDREYFDEEYEH